MSSRGSFPRYHTSPGEGSVPSGDHHRQEGAGQTICHVTFQPVENDARVNRSVSAAQEVNANAVLVAPGHGLSVRKLTFGRKLRLGLSHGATRIFGSLAAKAAYWSQHEHRLARDRILQIRPDIIHAHDWDALPAAVSAGRMLGKPVIYDSHEFAREMHQERLLWRTTMSPAIARLEDSYIPDCARVIVVSEGIGREMRRLVAGCDPVVIRNVPELVIPEELPERREPDDPGRQLLIHYHGILAAGRGLEESLKALALLGPGYRLRLVGPERQPSYLQALRELAGKEGVSAQLEIHDAVPAGQLVHMAATADIGLCVLDSSSLHNRFALPNKLFEYIMAGLFIVASDGEDMAAVVNGHRAGTTVSGNSAAAIANAIRSANPAKMEETRKRNLATARKLNWENERGKLAALYRQLTG